MLISMLKHMVQYNVQLESTMVQHHRRGHVFLKKLLIKISNLTRLDHSRQNDHIKLFLGFGCGPIRAGAGARGYAPEVLGSDHERKSIKRAR